MSTIRRTLVLVGSLLAVALVPLQAAIALPVLPADRPDGNGAVPPAVTSTSSGTSIWVFVAVAAIAAATTLLLTLAAQRMVHRTTHSAPVPAA